MIQRIQSLYLTSAMLLSLLCFTGNVFSFTDESEKTINLILKGDLIDQGGDIIAQVENIWPLTIILILIASLSLITIFLFRKRKIQLILAISGIMMSTGLILALSWYAVTVMNDFNLTIIPGIKMAVPFLILIFSVLAYRSIVKDDRLVKSYDRLR